ncbi:gamma-glutamylcyclotransferase [Pseudoalteromonas sp. NEC-BIFX-2020_015]|uniref:gamma-glutamylcyclotransferase family protein n=1 Tax=Pseudoalteromonas sp. NEC-BIFX-2020_015 TaxID=2729544 RepID=UPI0014613DB0|nr:gamma-glutamylcyclotransferase family protein [Pseudoalteromonas sp. NEC-BIFX-2020_015]NMR26265.1 gamma-glutamylcyclotransferase [Pseudoalteromonas sp. NEC-BIFX-2020_015]
MTIYNFSFGSNMSSNRLLARLPNAKRVGTAILDGYELTFDMVSLDGSGKGNVRPSNDQNTQVYGVVYQLNHDEKSVLDDIEGPRYDCVDVQVTLLDGQVLNAHCYIANTTNEDILPYDWYMQHVHRGALEACVPNEYSEAIKSRQTCRDSNSERAAIEFAVHQQ